MKSNAILLRVLVPLGLLAAIVGARLLLVGGGDPGRQAPSTGPQETSGAGGLPVHGMGAGGAVSVGGLLLADAIFDANAPDAAPSVGSKAPAAPATALAGGEPVDLASPQRTTVLIFASKT